MKKIENQRERKLRQIENMEESEREKRERTKELKDRTYILTARLVKAEVSKNNKKMKIKK